MGNNWLFLKVGSKAGEIQIDAFVALEDKASGHYGGVLPGVVKIMSTEGSDLMHLLPMRVIGNLVNDRTNDSIEVEATPRLVPRQGLSHSMQDLDYLWIEFNTRELRTHRCTLFASEF